jgi:hypothetical protein
LQDAWLLSKITNGINVRKTRELRTLEAKTIKNTHLHITKKIATFASENNLRPI